MNYSYNPYWQQRIIDMIHCAVNAYPRTIMIRVDLRFPARQDKADNPITYLQDTYKNDDAAISRFIDSLKAKIKASQSRRQRENKRVHLTTLRYLWVKEYGKKEGRKHYHVLLFLNRDSWCGCGHFDDDRSLASLIKQAWCSALGLDYRRYSELSNIPRNAVVWINRGNSQDMAKAWDRASYLAKEYSKSQGERERNFGCSQG